MRKFLLVGLTFLLNLGLLQAQDKTITGKVTDSGDGSPIPGVTVTVKGSTRGTTTDGNGKYSLAAPSDATTLVFSFIGFQVQEVAISGRSEINVGLESDVTALQEIVITALGQSRDKKSLGYAVQELSADKITAARESNVANALAGKIAGVQVLGQSGAKFGTPNIRIRGVNSLLGGDPLYVVDGTPVNGIEDVNMDDVDNLTVLKGASATALYGNRASGGVIVITTKKAKSGETSFAINHSSTLDMIGLLPKYQNEYGGGYSQEWDTFTFNPSIHPADWASFDGQKILDYSADESWGPKLDGTLHRSAWSWQPGPEFGQLTPFEASPNNVRDFFQKPVSHNTNIAFAKGGDNYQSRISYTHIATNGIIPNSSQSKDYISAKNRFDFTKQFSATLNINYTRTTSNNVPSDGYGVSGTNSVGINNSTITGNNQTIGSFNQWFQRQLKIEDLKNYKNPDGTYRSWNIGGPLDPKPKYWDSPYTQMYENTNKTTVDRIFGDFGLAYKITDFLTASVTARKDLKMYATEGRVAYGTLNAGGKGAYAVGEYKYDESNYEALLSFNKTFGKISLLANAGGNIRQNLVTLNVLSTNGGLTTPGFYNIAASKDRPGTITNKYERKVNSVFGNVSLGYGDLVYVEGSIRNDWASTLPTGNNSYLYPSVSTSFIFTELVPINKILSFGKVRLGYAQVGTDTDPYRIGLTYPVGSVFNGSPTMYLPSELPNANLKPGLTSSYEGGLDLRFLSDHISAEITIYRNDNKNQIIPLPVNPTSGYNTALINAGLIRTQGLEVHIGATPVKTSNFTWNTDINFDKSTSSVVELDPRLKNYQLESSWRGITLNAREGEEWGLIVGKKIRRDANGKRLIDEDGRFIVDENQPLGSVLPKFKGGFLNTFTYKNFTLRINADFVVGGKFFSVTRMFNAYSGLAAETAGLNELGNPKRDPADEGGGILLDGVREDGTPNTTRIDAQALYEDHLFALHDYWVFDKTYIKLREVSLGYSFPSALISKWRIKSAKLSFIVRNPVLIYSAIGGGIDISETENIWTEGGQLPPVRSFGINLNLGL
jgi:TonB-linked SusC/RagA family outer membrane protein